MNSTALYPSPRQYQEQDEDDFTLKEKINYTLLTGLGVSLIIYLSVKYSKKKAAEKSDALSFTDGTSQTIAKKIKMAFENDGMPGTNTKKLREILTKIKSKEQMRAVWLEYRKQYGSWLYSDMKSELQSTENDEMEQIIAAKPDKEGQSVPGEIIYRAWAIRLKSGFDKMYGFIPGTDEDCIITVLNEIPTQRAFINVGVAYYKEYKRQIFDDLKAEFNYWTYPTYLMMITNKPKS